MVDDKILAFSHIPKTGGSMLFQLLRRQYAPEQVVVRPSDEDFAVRRQAALVIPFNLPNKRLMRAHTDWSLQDYIEQPLELITMLRHPIDRVVSLYRFVRRQSAHEQNERANQMTLREFVEWEYGHHQCQNVMTRWIAGTYNYLPYTPGMLDADLHIAKERLNDIMWFGVLEELDLSLEWLNALTGWPLENPGKVNYAPDEATQLVEDNRGFIYDHNRHDWELYEYALKLVRENAYAATYVHRE